MDCVKPERPQSGHRAMVYATSTVSGVASPMIDRSLSFRHLTRAVAALSLIALAAGLGGCAGIGDSFASAAFVDPAKYEQFDCKQLEAERKLQAKRTAELQGLIDKAQTGTGGTVVSQVAYGNDYISARASSKLAEETWQRSKCVASAPSASDESDAAPAVPAAPVHSARRR